MLNRRILRVKAMQALYGYFTAVESLKEVAHEHLLEIHSLDPALHDFSEKPAFEARKKLAVKLFDENYQNIESLPSEHEEQEVIKAVKEEIENFASRTQQESKQRRKEMMADLDKVYQLYIKFLSLPAEFEQIEKLEAEKKQKTKAAPFVDHPVVEALKSSKPFEKAALKNGASWGDELAELKAWYKQELIKSETLAPFFDGSSTEGFLTVLFKKVIFKNENITGYLEAKNLRWAENQPVVKSMVLKTIKSLEDNEPLELAELTKNGKDDFDFFGQIFDGVLKENRHLDELIASKTKNWDVERIALTDLVILKIALIEMMACPSIPLKVSINEAIEISKQYSTPKSKQFVNGVLDVLSNELTSEGKIRKSGRGLIDNR